MTFAPTRDNWKARLLAVPVRNQAAEVVEHPDGTVSISVKNQRPRYLVPPLSWVIPFHPQRTLELDGPGSRVWRACDGAHTVEAICEHFMQTYGLSFHEARGAVEAFLAQLVQRGAAALIENSTHQEEDENGRKG